MQSFFTVNVWNREAVPERTQLINEELKHLQPDLISFQEAIQPPADNQLADLVDNAVAPFAVMSNPEPSMLNTAPVGAAVSTPDGAAMVI
jgi:hypothetical protein